MIIVIVGFESVIILVNYYERIFESVKWLSIGEVVNIIERFYRSEFMVVVVDVK